LIQSAQATNDKKHYSNTATKDRSNTAKCARIPKVGAQMSGQRSCKTVENTVEKVPLNFWCMVSY